MARPFSPATAEQVVNAVEAVVVRRSGADADFVAEFCDIPRAQSEAALQLAADLGLLKISAAGVCTVVRLCAGSWSHRMSRNGQRLFAWS
jgi:hypothetical protein